MAGSSLSAQPRRLYQWSARMPSNTISAAGQYLVPRQGSPIAPGQADANSGVLMRLDLEDLEVYEKRTLFEYVCQILTGNVAPNASVDFALFAVAGLAGGGVTSTVTLGAEVPNSRTASLVLPGSNGVSELVRSPSFELPGDGIYALVATFSAALAANSGGGIVGHLAAVSR